MSSKPEIKDLLGLSEPATKLIEMVSNAIGTLYEPRKIKKLADAEAYRIKTITETARKTNFNGEIEFIDGKIKISNNDTINQEIKPIFVSEIKRLINENNNIRKIADFAYSELENNQNKIDDEVDEDWRNNFFDKSRKIYSEDLQFIFGKILAGEIKQPGTYSKRLLVLLSNLSQKEAKIFSKVAKYVIRNCTNNAFIISDDDILKSFGIKLDEIILLEEAGLINSNPLLITGTNSYEYKNYLIKFIDNKPELRVYLLTKSGTELEGIVSNEIDLEYLSKIKNKYNVEKMDYSLILLKKEDDGKTSYRLTDTTDVI